MGTASLMDWLIDTNILIDHLRGTPRATAFLRRARKQQTLWVSVITVAEIHAGQRMKQAKERATVMRFLKLFRIAYLDAAGAAHGGEDLRGYAKGLAAALSAATAINKRRRRETRNARHFPGIRELICESPHS